MTAPALAESPVRSTPRRRERRAITPEQMLHMPEARHAELIDGRLVEKPAMSMESSIITSKVNHFMRGFADPRGLGEVMGEQTTYRCFNHSPNQVRRPDVSFIAKHRLKPDMYRGHVREVPDLVAEVISANDEAEDVESRIDDFLRAGVPLIWVIYAISRKARVYRDGEPAGELRGDGVLEGEPVLPGFRLSLADLFAGMPELPRLRDRKAERRAEEA